VTHPKVLIRLGDLNPEQKHVHLTCVELCPGGCFVSSAQANPARPLRAVAGNFVLGTLVALAMVLTPRTPGLADGIAAAGTSFLAVVILVSHEPPGTLLDRLWAGEPPPWLRRVAAEPSGYVLYEKLP
jgi:hypothetical protein